MRPIRHVLLVLAVALIAASCGGDEPQAGGDRGGSQPAPSESPGDANKGGGRDGDQEGDGADPEDLAPDFTVETFQGDTFRLSEHRGVPVVLNFWESW